MTGPDASKPDATLDSVLDGIEALAKGQTKVPLKAVLDSIGVRGFGPLMVVLSALLLLPVGMVPGVPAVVAILLMVIGLNILVLRRHLTVPQRLARINVSARILQSSVNRARPVVRWLRPVLIRRLTGLIESPLALLMISVILLATGAVILVVGFIPGLPFMMSLHILLLGLGLTARDGLVGLLGFAAVVPEAAAAWWLFF